MQPRYELCFLQKDLKESLSANFGNRSVEKNGFGEHFHNIFRFVKPVGSFTKFILTSQRTTSAFERYANYPLRSKSFERSLEDWADFPWGQMEKRCKSHYAIGIFRKLELTHIGHIETDSWHVCASQLNHAGRIIEPPVVRGMLANFSGISTVSATDFHDHWIPFGNQFEESFDIVSPRSLSAKFFSHTVRRPLIGCVCSIVRK